MVSWVAAEGNTLVIEFSATGDAVQADVALDIFKDSYLKPAPQEITSGVQGDLFWGNRAFTEDVDIPTSTAAVMRVTGAATKSPADNHRNLQLTPGVIVTVALTMASNFDDKNHLDIAKRLALKFDIQKTRTAHEA